MNQSKAEILYTGGCACGDIRYACNAPPEFSLLCQCRQCQRISGSGHAAQFAVAADQVSLSGTLNYFDLVADSGNSVQSGFCPRCGCPILKRSSGHPQFTFLHAATLDEPERFGPQMLVWSQSAQPWDHTDPNLPRK